MTFTEKFLILAVILCQIQFILLFWYARNLDESIRILTKFVVDLSESYIGYASRDTTAEFKDLETRVKFEDGCH